MGGKRMKAAVIMGSASDASKVEGCIQILKDFEEYLAIGTIHAERFLKAGKSNLRYTAQFRHINSVQFMVYSVVY